MMNAKEAAKRFEDQRKRCRTLHLLYLLGLVITLGAMFLWGTKVSFIIFIPVLVFYFAVVRGSMKKYASDWREFCVRLFTEKHFGHVEYTYKADAEALPLYKSHPLAVKSSKGTLLARNLATGSNAGIDATFLDSTLPIGEGKAIRFLVGCWMGMSFDTIVNEPVRIVKGDPIPAAEALNPCEKPEGMPGECAFVTPDGTLELPEDCIAPLKALLEDIAHDGVVELRPEGLFVFLPQKLINVQPPSMKTTVVPQMIERIVFPELDDAYMLALRLRK